MPDQLRAHRGSPFTTAGFARLIERAGVLAELDFNTHPRMLRHAGGVALANKGHDLRALQALSRTPQHPTYGWLHRTVAGSIQGANSARAIGKSKSVGLWFRHPKRSIG